MKYLIIFIFVLLGYIDNSFAQDATLIYKNTVNSTVTIKTDHGSQGSGFFVGQNILVTNYHVIKGALSANCYLNNSDTKYKIDGYLAIDESVDLILLKVSALNKPALKFSSSAVSIGQKVFVIGSPIGLSATITDGIVSGMRDFEGNKLIQMSAPISPGSSGGPVLNSSGELIGISVLQFKDGQNLNFAIPKSYIQILLDFKKSTVIDLSTLTNSNNISDENSKNAMLTETEALQFLRTYSNDWGCEKYAQGTYEIRLQYSIENGKLIILEYFPSYHPYEFIKVELNLNKINMIQYEPKEGCNSIYIKHKDNQMKISKKNRNTQMITEMSTFDVHLLNEKVGYTIDSIKLKKDEEQTVRAERLMNALKFLAEEYGAILKSSGF